MKVLVVDDEPLIRRSLLRAFTTAGHQVCEACDGPSGLDLWTKENPDLAFVDVLMPGMSGPQLLQSLPEELRKRTKIILMSAFTGKEGSSPIIADSADLFLAKPFDDIFKIVKMAEGILTNE